MILRSKYIKKLRLWWFYLSFIGFALFIGEWHPFSRFPMYNSLPNWSYAFYITDTQNNIIPAVSLNTNAGELSHLFGSICQSYQIKYGDGCETKNQLRLVGNNIYKILQNDKRNIDLLKKGIKIHRIYFFYKSNHIQSISEIIYE